MRLAAVDLGEHAQRCEVALRSQAHEDHAQQVAAWEREAADAAEKAKIARAALEGERAALEEAEAAFSRSLRSEHGS